MSEMQIRKGVPIPEATARAGSNMQLLQGMAVGDSVFFDAPIAKKAARFYRVATKLGCKIVIRKENDGVALWKTTECTKPVATNGSTAPGKAAVKKALPAVKTPRVATKKKAAKRKAKK